MYRWIQCDFLFVVVLVVSVLPAATISISSSTLSQSRRKEHLPRQSIEIGINKMKRKKRTTTTVHDKKKIVHVYLVFVGFVFGCVILNWLCRRFL